MKKTKLAVFIPTLVGMSIATSLLAVVLRAGALGHSIIEVNKLQADLNQAIEDSAWSLASLQRQITSLAEVALQNRRALDLLTASKGGTCVFLQEQCYYINESGIVETGIKNLQSIRDRLNSWPNLGKDSGFNIWESPLLTWLMPILTPLIVIGLLLTIAPCFLRFAKEKIQEASRVTLNQLLLHPYVPVPTEPSPDHN